MVQLFTDFLEVEDNQSSIFWAFRPGIYVETVIVIGLLLVLTRLLFSAPVVEDLFQIFEIIVKNFTKEAPQNQDYSTLAAFEREVSINPSVMRRGGSALHSIKA